MADKIKIVAATGKSTDGITGETIPTGTPVAHVHFNARCAPFLTAESLRKLADEIESGVGTLFNAGGPTDEQERWPEMGWAFACEQLRLKRLQK